jgi:hypothetical protein
MSNTYKSQALIAELRDALAKRFATVSPVQFDTDGNPFILVGAGTAGSQSALVKLRGETVAGAVDGLGLTQRSYSPHIAQVVLETSTIANVALMTEANKLVLLGEVTKFGTRVDLYMSANTNAVGVEDIVPANLRATWEQHLKWRLMSNS